MEVAIRQTAQRVADVMYDSVEKKQSVVEQEFFYALYTELGILWEKEKQEKLKRRVPFIALVEEDGAYLYYWSLVKQGETLELQHNWTEKIEFSVNPDWETEEKKRMVAELLEEYASGLITEYNYIAQQYGLQYTVTMPRFLQNTQDTLEFPMLFAVVQGWPLTASGNLLYDNCVDAGVYLREVEHYIVEFPKNLQNTKSYYHRRDCVEISAIQQDERIVSKEEAIREYGAFPCEKCIPMP